MKNLTKIVAVVAILLLFASCGSSKKGCGFTASVEQLTTQNETNLG